MNHFQISLDKYITSQLDDGFDHWCDDILDHGITPQFYDENEDWLLEYDGQCNKWMNKLFNKGKMVMEASRIIQRAFKLYII
jgi:hypothetical protein